MHHFARLADIACAISRCSIARTAARAQDSISSFVMALSFALSSFSTLLNSFEVGCAPARFPL